MKTREEIKKGLELHYTAGCCKECPYTADSEFKKTCFQLVASDALDYITQLESRLAQVERERDAAISDLGHAADCDTCKHQILNGGWYVSSNCMDCSHGCSYEWRGVCEENTKEDEQSV